MKDIEVNYTWEIGYLIVEVWGDADYVRYHNVYLSFDEAQEVARKIEEDTGSDVHIECVDVQSYL